MSATAFSSGDDIISRKLECTQNKMPAEQLDETYETNRSVKWIRTNGFKMVALQFPDILLGDAPAVADKLQTRLPDCSIFILGDTSYGSCCVDEVAAQHYRADCIIHYGHACLSPTARLPVLYLFGRSSIDVKDCHQSIKDACSHCASTKAVLIYETAYVHAVDGIYLQLQDCFSSLILSRLSIPEHSESVESKTEKSAMSFLSHQEESQRSNPSQTSHPADDKRLCIQKCGRIFLLPEGETIESYSIVFIGDPESSLLTTLMMTFNRCAFFSYNPITHHCRRETMNINKALMKRYYLIERAKDAGIVGIVVGTLGVAKYRDMIDHLKSLLKKTGKKSYTFVVGKLNPAKLANFAEIEIYVLVSCPESSLFDQSDFYQPLVSPLEMEIACNQAREWTGEYSTDFRELLPGGSMYIEPMEGCEQEPRVDVSLISNKVRTLGVHDSPAVSSVPGHELLVRSEAMTVAHISGSAGEFFSSRSWKGLEQKLGETPVVKASEGRFGIAASYENETSSS